MKSKICKTWTKPRGCLVFESPVAKFASHDPSASIASGIDPDPDPVPAPVPVPELDPSGVPSDFEAFWLNKKTEDYLVFHKQFFYGWFHECSK